MTEVIDPPTVKAGHSLRLGSPAYYGRFGLEPAGALAIVYPPVDGRASQVRRLTAYDGTWRHVHVRVVAATVPWSRTYRDWRFAEFPVSHGVEGGRQMKERCGTRPTQLTTTTGCPHSRSLTPFGPPSMSW